MNQSFYNTGTSGVHVAGSPLPKFMKRKPEGYLPEHGMAVWICRINLFKSENKRLKIIHFRLA
jgi:hypothetical protein